MNWRLNRGGKLVHRGKDIAKVVVEASGAAATKIVAAWFTVALNSCFKIGTVELLHDAIDDPLFFVLVIAEEPRFETHFLDTFSGPSAKERHNLLPFPMLPERHHVAIGLEISVVLLRVNLIDVLGERDKNGARRIVKFIAASVATEGDFVEAPQKLMCIFKNLLHLHKAGKLDLIRLFGDPRAIALGGVGSILMKSMSEIDDELGNS